jgi:uncharacterized protein (UPF0548 family)
VPLGRIAGWPTSGPSPGDRALPAGDDENDERVEIYPKASGLFLEASKEDVRQAKGHLSPWHIYGTFAEICSSPPLSGHPVRAGKIVRRCPLKFAVLSLVILPKLRTRVRFSSPALRISPGRADIATCGVMPNGSGVHSTCTSGSTEWALIRGRTKRPFNQGFLAVGLPISGCGSLERKAEDGLPTMKRSFRISAQKGEPASKTSARSGGTPRHSRFQVGVPASAAYRRFSSAVQAPPMGPGWGRLSSAWSGKADTTEASLACRSTLPRVPVTVVRPSEERLQQLHRRLADRPVTCDGVGSTEDGPLPSGYRHDRESIVVGTGPEAWNAGRVALTTWKAHQHAGVAISPADALLEAGTVVIATTRLGPIWVVAPCRIVYTTNETDRFGFAYGTLPGHPEEGEEAFHVQRRADGSVSFEIVAFSRPATWLVRLAGPIGRAAQVRATRLYLDGVRTFVAGVS